MFSIYMFISFWTALLAYGAHASLIGYKCDSGLSINRTTISLIDTQDCAVDRENYEEEKIQIVLTQTSNYIDIPFRRCHSVMRHMMFRCGKSIDTNYNGGMYTEVQSYTNEMCSQLFNKGTVTITPSVGYPRKFTDIPKNVQYRYSYTSLGSIDQSGSCAAGDAFTRNQNHYDRPVRNTEVEILTTSGKARVDFENNKIIFPNGVTCNYKGQSCEHADYGHLFWDIQTPDCKNEEGPKSLVYQGSASLITTRSKQTNITTRYIQAKQGEVHFQIQLLEQTTFVCGYRTQLTEHPQLFATILSPGSPQFPLSRGVSSTDTNIMLYMGSKLVFVVRSMQDRIKDLFNRFQEDRCYLLNKINRQYMTTAIQSPIEFAFQYFNEPGYTAIQRGEVIHIAKCTPVEVYPVALKPGECYKQLVVSSENRTMYMAARSRLLTNIGTLLDCSKGVPSMFKLHGKWVVQSTDGSVEAKNPQVITDSILSYEFTDLTDITRGGTYTSESTSNMQKALIMPLEEEIITSRISLSVQSRGDLPEGYSFVNGPTPADHESTKGEVLGWYDKLWSRFMGMGSFFAGLMAIAMVVKTISWVLGTFVNFKILNDMFGCCGACMFAWWDSMAHHLYRQESFPWLKSKITSKAKKPTLDIERGEIQIPMVASAPGPENLFTHRYSHQN